MKIGLVGYGKMGKGIFNLFSSLDHEIIVWMRKSEIVRESKIQIERKLRRALKNEIIDQDQFQEKLSTLTFTDRLESLRGCDLVVESIAEDFHEKVSMLKRLESILSPSALLLTNTSSLSINQLARELDHGERFCGFHFFYPIPLVNLIEVIKWDGVSGETVNFLTSFARELGKMPIIINDAPASGINDILSYHFFEGYYMLEQGLAAPSQIDKAALNFFRVGPCESTDIIGSKLIIETAEITVKVRKSGMPIPDLLYKLILQERMGRDCGRGLFVYHGEKMEDDSREFYLNPYQKHSFQASEQDASESMIQKRLLYALFNGFLHSVSRNVSSEKELNAGMREVLGMREGPADMMRSIGMDTVMREFDLLANQVGRRFRQ
ncbi:MAG: 3-hydroxyacyl-CoA dehydrogenase NAD-binding domain-containing protein [bacterium]